MANALPLLLLGAGAIAIASGKKKRRVSGEAIVFEDEIVTGGEDLPKVGSREVAFASDLSKFKIGGTWKINVLDAWLNKRRLAGKLATVDHDEGWLYTLLVDDPTTWLGDVTGTGKVGGSIAYGALWLMATVGIGVYATGFAAGAANIQAASAAANTTRALQILGPRATALAQSMYQKGFASSQIRLALMDFGGTQSMNRFGVGKAIGALSGGAAVSGVGMAGSLLTEIGVSKGFSNDLAASAAEAAAEFTLNHKVKVAGEEVPIALLPSTYPSVQEFNKYIMGYIIKFQKMHFED